ncbi:MAG: amidophosphoribosyltransferase [Phycisphaerae bacterium]|nr:amidophosphoribosyltransferase [Phycisphaerae bacterium]
MSDQIGHECGLAMIRLRKPLAWYQKEYGDPAWGLRRLFLLMEKQHNRGQDGAGIATARFDMPAGDPFLERIRTNKRNPIERIYDDAMQPMEKLSQEDLVSMDPVKLKRKMRFLGEAMIGHLRYGTHAGRSSKNCHPFLRRNTVASRNVALAGNFNLTNSTDLFRKLLQYGLNPVGDSDTQVVLERLGYSLDREHEQLETTMGPGSFHGLEGRELAEEISRQLNPTRILERALEDFDGGYVLCALLGNGDVMISRDPAGIRPAFYHVDDEVVAMASERAALVTVFDLQPEQVLPIPPGHALSVKRSGVIDIEPVCEPMPVRQCTFERIYFSRGNDKDIYRERKHLGRNLAEPIVQQLGGDIESAVYGFIPNTSETAFIGLMEQLQTMSRDQLRNKIRMELEAGTLDASRLDSIFTSGPRGEKVAQKDQRLRTFITHDAARRDLVSHVYDITHGTITPDSSLVVIDDSIVRGTTLRESIITMLSRLNPRNIIIASSAPPIMYPDCYGIDMSQLGRFIAFEAAVKLLEERGQEDLLEEVETLCLAQASLAPERMVNHVKLIYDRFSLKEISGKVAELIRPAHLDWNGTVSVVYQSVDGLHQAMPEFTGDWYFTGDYPTPGGYRVLNTAYLNWRRNDTSRSY